MAWKNIESRHGGQRLILPSPGLQATSDRLMMLRQTAALNGYPFSF